jgi:hypothetical protein
MNYIKIHINDNIGVKIHWEFRGLKLLDVPIFLSLNAPLKFLTRLWIKRLEENVIAHKVIWFQGC